MKLPEIGDRVQAKNDIGIISKGEVYEIKGQGDLTWNFATDKEGFGYMIQVEKFEDPKVAFSKIIKEDYYFTKDELLENFYIDQEIERNYKIEKILKDD